MSQPPAPPCTSAPPDAPAPPGTPGRRDTACAPELTAALLALGVLLAGLIYGTNALSAGYVHDDHPAVVNNANVTWPPPVAQIFTTPWFGPKRGFATQGLSRPLVTLSYAIEAGLGLESGGRHLVNLLLYGFVSGLVGMLVATLLCGGAPNLQRTAALVATLLFAAHPLHTSSVLCVSYRPELLAALLALLATLALLASARGQRGAGAMAVALLLLALWSKESALTVLAPWTIWAVARRWPARAWRWIVVAAVVCGAWLAWRATWLPLPVVTAHDNPLGHVGVVARLLGALWLITYAAGKLLWPYNLAPDETFDALPVLSPDASYVAGALLLVVSLAALAGWDLWRTRRGAGRAGGVAAGIAWFVAAWLPVSHLLFPSTVLFADRLLFLPSVAALAGLAVLLSRGLLAARYRRHAALGLLLGLCLPWVSQSLAEGSHWRSDELLYAHGAEVRPRSLRMRYNLGQLRLADDRAEAAVPDLEAAHAIDPGATAPWTLLVQAHTRLGHCARTNTLLGEVARLARRDDATRKAAVDADVFCHRYRRAFAFGRKLRRVTLEWGRKVYVAGVAAGDPRAEAWARHFTPKPAEDPRWVAAAVYAEGLAKRPRGALRRLEILSRHAPTMRAPLMKALELCDRARRLRGTPRADQAMLAACARWPGEREAALLRAARPVAPSAAAPAPAPAPAAKSSAIP